MPAEKRDFEEILGIIGRFGTYHRVFFGITLPLGIIQGMVFVCNVLLTDGTQDYTCHLEENLRDMVETVGNRADS